MIDPTGVFTNRTCVFCICPAKGILTDHNGINYTELIRIIRGGNVINKVSLYGFVLLHVFFAMGRTRFPA